VFDLGRAGLIVSSVVVGAFVTGTVPLVLGRIGELLPHQPARQKAAWSTATVAFAIAQAVAAYGMSFVFERSGGDYRMLFIVGACAIVTALALDLVVAVASFQPRRRRHQD
jgi:predicted MFS family arabinose efflux permease